MRFRSQAQYARYQRGLRGSAEHDGGGLTGCRSSRPDRISSSVKVMALPQQLLLVLLLFEDRRFDRDLFLLLTTLWSVDTWCCVDDYSQFQNAVYSLLPITTLHCDASWDILCQISNNWGEIPPLHTMLCCWTGSTPIKLGHPSSSPFKKRANIPGPFHLISVN